MNFLRIKDSIDQIRLVTEPYPICSIVVRLTSMVSPHKIAKALVYPHADNFGNPS